MSINLRSLRLIAVSVAIFSLVSLGLATSWGRITPLSFLSPNENSAQAPTIDVAAVSYFSKATATDFTDPNSWGTNADGTGTSPATVSSADDFTIQNGAAMTMAAGSASVKSLTINAGSLTIGSNTLTVAVPGQNNTTFAVNNLGALNVSGGVLNVNGNFVLATGGVFNQSGGAIVVDGNNGGVAATSVASGTAIVAFNSSNLTSLNLTGGTFTIVDPHAATTATNVLAFSGTATGQVAASTNHTFRFGDGISSDAGGNAVGFQLNPWLTTTGLKFGNVEFNGPTGTNRITTLGSSFNALVVGGNLTVNNGADLRHTGTSTTSGMVAVQGNLTVNTGGSFTSLGTVFFANPNYTSSTVITMSANSANQTVGGAGTYRNLTSPTTPTANFTSVTVNSSSSTGVTFNSLNAITGQPANTSSVSTTLTFSAGKISTAAGNSMILGTSVPAAGTLTVTAGGFAPGSSYGRWSTAAGTGSAITAGADPTTTTSRFPFVDSTGANRSIWLQRVTPTAAGVYAVTYADASTNSSVSIVDGGYTVQTRYDGNWSFSTLGTSPAAATYTLAVVAPGAYPASNGNNRITNAAAPAGGAHQNGTATPGAQRTGLTLAQLTGAPLFIGIANADLAFASVTSGDWSNAATWNKGTVPTATDAVSIAAGTTVTVSSGTQVAQTVSVSATGGLTVSGGSLSVGGSSGTGVTNSGVVTISGGSLNVGPQDNSFCNRLFTNGSSGTVAVGSGALNIAGRLLISLNSSLNQTGGDINVDGNAAGVAANSIAAGTAIVDINPSNLTSVNLTGGRLTIVDPHVGTTSTSYVLLVNGATNGPLNVTTGHTIRFGNGSSVDAGGSSTQGFFVNTWNTTTGMPFGNVVVEGPGGTNRFLSSNFQQPILGNVTVNSGGEYRIFNSYVNGNINVNAGGTFTSTSALRMGNSTFVDGSSVGFSPSTNAQTIGGPGTYRNLTAAPTASFAALQIQNSNPAGVTLLDADKSLSGVLTFVQGNINTGTNKLAITASGSDTGAGQTTGYVNGKLQRNFATGSAINRTFNVGTSNFAPVTLAFDTVGTAGDIVVSSTSNDHPNIAGSNLNSTKSVNRYWTVTNAGVAFGTAAVTLNWQAADVDGLATPANFIIGKFDSPTWTYPTVASPAATSIQATGITSFSDFAVGEFGTPNAAPTITNAGPITRQEGSAASNSTIANVTDDGGNGAVVVTVTSANPSNGVTISNIVNNAGVITADVAAACGATNASFTLQASDGSLTATDTLVVNVTPNTAPTFSYGPVTVANGGSTTNPVVGPADNGSIASYAIQGQGTYTGTVSVNSAGLVTISGAAPTGVHTITVRATDNCGLFTDNTFQLTVTAPPAVSVTGSTGADGNYPTLKAAFDAINANATQTGNNISVSIFADTDEGTSTAALNAGNWASMSITPAGIRTVAGATTAGSPLIDLNGADNVTIDGMSSLTISNSTTSGTAGTSTIRLINGATANTIKNATVLGSSTTATTTSGGTILVSTSTVAGGNSNNNITNNNIGPAGANLPNKGVMGLGSASPNANTGNTVSGNNIYDFFTPGASVAGIRVDANNDAWAVTNNKLYQTAPRVFTGAFSYTGISAGIGTGSISVTGNKIGFGAADGTGVTNISGNANTFAGISLTVGTTTPSNIQGNTVSGLSINSAGNAVVVMSGIVFAGRADVGTVTGNKIGSLDGSSTITVTLSSAGAVYCLRDNNSTAISNAISNNQIGAITINGTGPGTNGFRGILSGTSTSATLTLANNQVGGTGSGAITDSLVGAYAMYAISISGPAVTATGNVVQNISGNSNAASLIVMSGMLVSSTATVGAHNISQNTIRSLSNNAGSASNSIYALYCNFPSATANIVERNFVHSLSVTSSALTSQLVGILPAAGTGTYKNNMVRLGYDAAGASITPGYVIYGMFEIAGTNSIYNNTVYVGGTGVAASSTTYAFVSNVASGNRNYVDNIFWNARSNASGTAKNYAVAYAGTTTAGITSDKNDLFANGTGGVTGTFNGIDRPTLADWQTTGLDPASVSVDPALVNPTGNAATVNLHLSSDASPVANIGAPLAAVINDFDGETRSASIPDIGADEIVGVVADLSITKTDGVTTAAPGGSVTYTITASNAGPNAVTGATVADTFPASLIGTWTCVGAGGGTCTASGSGNINDTVNLPVGGSVTYTVSATISASATGSLSNTATVAAPAGVTDPTPGNNSATDTDTLASQADLSITKTDGVTTATAGGSVTYTITASNAGPSNAPGATVADTFPASLTGTWTCVGAGGGTCTASGSGNINDTVNLPSGGSVTYTVSATVSASATGTLSNTATVTAPAGVTDPNPGNNSATDTDTIGQSADLSIVKTDGVTQYLPGGSLTYTITASNSGPSNVTGATVTDLFPGTLNSVTWTCVGTSGGTCTASGSGNISDTVDIPAGGSVKYTANAVVSNSAAGTLSNTATVTAPGSVTDPNPANNSSTDSDTIAPASMQFSSATYRDDESQTAVITIKRTGDLSGSSTVQFSTQNGTATGGSSGSCGTMGIDFEQVSNQLVTFTSGQDTQTVSVKLCADGTNEVPDETINLTLTNPTGGAVGAPATAVLNINDTAAVFRNTAAIDMLLGQPASTYPSQINVAGAPNVVGSMRVTLYDVWHVLPDNIDVLLVGPNGAKYVLMGDVGGPLSIDQNSPVTLTFNDFATAAMPDAGPLMTRQYVPTTCETPVSNFPGTAPAGPYNEPGCTLSRPQAKSMFGSFGLSNPNGVWSLYVRDDNGALRPFDSPSTVVGQIAGGWGLEFSAPTAGEVSLSGAVTSADGRGITNARISVTGGNLTEPITAVTGRRGLYVINGLVAGETYVVTVGSRRFTFTEPSRVITLTDNVTGVNFTATNNGR